MNKMILAIHPYSFMSCLLPARLLGLWVGQVRKLLNGGARYAGQEY